MIIAPDCCGQTNFMGFNYGIWETFYKNRRKISKLHLIQETLVLVLITQQIYFDITLNLV